MKTFLLRLFTWWNSQTFGTQWWTWLYGCLLYTSSDFNGFLFHPGGRKLLETMEQALGLTRKQFEHSWAVLRDYGNMSSATALFVLDRALKAGARGPHLLAAFGPGFSAYFVVADL